MDNPAGLAPWWDASRWSFSDHLQKVVQGGEEFENHAWILCRWHNLLPDSQRSEEFEKGQVTEVKMSVQYMSFSVDFIAVLILFP